MSAPVDTQTQVATRKRHWLVGFLRSQLFAAVLGVILGAAIPPLVGAVFATNPGEIAQVMAEEAQAAESHDTNLVARIYTADAVVTDSGCLAKASPTVFRGLTTIQNRYASLPYIPTLQHVNIAVSNWDSFSRFTVSHATATSATVGVLLTGGSPPVYQQISGYEVWSFAKVAGSWRITSFTFGLCSL